MQVKLASALLHVVSANTIFVTICTCMLFALLFCLFCHHAILYWAIVPSQDSIFCSGFVIQTLTNLMNLIALNRLCQPVVLLCVHYTALPGSFHNIRIAKPHRPKGKQCDTDSLQTYKITGLSSLSGLSVSCCSWPFLLTLSCFQYDFSQLRLSCVLFFLYPYVCFSSLIPSCTMPHHRLLIRLWWNREIWWIKVCLVQKVAFMV